MDKKWIKQYQDGVPAEIDPNRYASLVDVIEQSLAQFTDTVAYLNMGAQLTYKELDEQSLKFATALQQDGFKKGDAIAVMMPNLLQYPVAILGILRAGMTVVNVNPLYTARELEHQLTDANVKAIVIVENFACTLASVIANTNVEQVYLTQLGDMLPKLKGWIVNTVVKHVKKMVPDFKLEGTKNFVSAVKQADARQFVRQTVVGDDIAFLQYTGGTTGVSKGAMLTHRNMVANLEQASGVIGPVLTNEAEMVVTALPLYHIFALTANCLTFMKFGATNLLITNPRDMPAFVKELSKYPFTVLTGVNTLFNGLLNTPGFDKLNFSKFRVTLGGGMAVQAPVAERWQDVTGHPLLEAYGLTECAPAVTINPMNLESYSGSIGVPVPSTDVKLVDVDGNIAADGEAGELYVRGPQVMKGYLNRPEATDEVIKDGWFATGDIATIDDKGFLYIVDRKKDMILVSGFNVYPNEIEEVAAMCDKVLEVGAVGVPHAESGEQVKLFVVKKDQSLTEAELIAHCRQNLTGYKVPKQVAFIDEMPKSNVGKILRRELRD